MNGDWFATLAFYKLFYKIKKMFQIGESGWMMHISNHIYIYISSGSHIQHSESKNIKLNEKTQYITILNILKI